MKKVYRFKMAANLLFFLSHDCAIPRKLRKKITVEKLHAKVVKYAKKFRLAEVGSIWTPPPPL